MSSLRNIKKDIDYLINEVVSDCFLHLHFRGKDNADAIENILTEAAELHNTLFDQVNARPKAQVKQHYKAISKKLIEGVDALFKKISALSKA